MDQKNRLLREAYQALSAAFEGHLDLGVIGNLRARIGKNLHIDQAVSLQSQPSAN